MAKNIEKTFFKEEFRRVNYEDIGEIIDYNHNNHVSSSYKVAVKKSINKDILTKKSFHLVVDLMSGGTAEIFPKILNELKIDNIILNSYPDESKLGSLQSMEKCSKSEVSSIVKSLNSDMGLIIYPNGQKLIIVTDTGEALEKETALFILLYLINYEKNAKKYKVILPTWAPDMMDESFENVAIERAKYSEFKASELKKYDVIATVDGSFAFTEFALHHDSMYSSLKIIEMLMKFDLKLSEILSTMEPFYYKHIKVACKQALKGTMMRKFLEDAKNKKSSSIDGVKIWTGENDWILMIPDQYEDVLNLYIQAKSNKSGNAIYKKYIQKIENWAQE